MEKKKLIQNIKTKISFLQKDIEKLETLEEETQ